MPKTYELLLVDNVDSLGIVGDVVKVRSGYARNFLLPRGLAETPSEEKIKELASRRAEAVKQLAELRAAREAMVDKLEGYEISIERSCNDQGLLYGSVSQQDVATLLQAAGFAVRARDVRLTTAVKRIDTYEVIIKPEVDLEATVKIHVKPDRPLEMLQRQAEDAAAAEAAANAAKGEAPAEGEEPAEGDAPKKAKKERSKDAGEGEEKPKGKKKG